MKKFFSLIALVGVFAACEPENLQTAFNVNDATATVVKPTVLCAAPDFDPTAVTITYAWSNGATTQSITGNPSIPKGTVKVTANYKGATASTDLSFPQIFAGVNATLTATIILPYNAGGYVIDYEYGDTEVADVEVYGLQAAAHGHGYGVAQEVEYEGEKFKVWMMENATEFILEDSYTWYIPYGYELDDFELLNDDFALESALMYAYFVEDSGIDFEEESYDFSVGAWSLYEVINPVITYVTPIIVTATPEEGSNNPEIGPVASFNMYDLFAACGVVEMAHPDHAAHYVPHSGHYTHDGHALHGDNNNAGGGIITAE